MDWGAQLQELLHGFLLFLPRLITALVIFVASIIVGGLVKRALKRALTPRVQDQEILELLGRLARWGVIILGTLAALDQVNFDVTSFVAGLGIAGFTIGFALQDIAKNFVAGIILLIRQPFEIGDAVEISGLSGTVLEISTRDTVLKSFDGEAVIVPNGDVFTSPIINYSKLPLRRRTVMIGLGYGEDVDRAIQLFLDVIQGVDGVLSDPVPTVLVDSLGDSALTLAARFWVNQTSHGLLDVQSAVVQAIKEIAEEHEIDLPYPTQTLRLEGGWPGEGPPAA
jgi:small-conductance mechanosensitive channel